MNARLPIAALALSLASGFAFAAAPTPAPTAPAKPYTTQSAAPAKHKMKLASHAPACKSGEVAVKGKCGPKKS